MDYLEKAIRVLDIEIFELKRLRDRLSESFARAVELIKEAVDAELAKTGWKDKTSARLSAESLFVIFE